jgi:hypothetical protein
MRPDKKRVAEWNATLLTETTRAHLRSAAERIAAAKMKGRGVTVVTGSGPNLHEGVTTLIAELIRRDVVDAVLTSSAVVAHEMAGTLDRVRRVRPAEHPALGISMHLLPRGGGFEVTELPAYQRAAIALEIQQGWDVYDRVLAVGGDSLIKAAGNMAWPMGPRTERLAREAEVLAKQSGLPLERVVGLGADLRTMIGAGAAKNRPVLVSIPQLVGGGAVGLAVGDAISITRRSRLIAEALAKSDVIIESAVALTQEVHDGPFELYTGHGIWSAWQQDYTYSLEAKSLVRIDLDANLELSWRQEREGAQVQQAVDRGLPKTKLTGIPFRMEMSGFARLEGSLPVTADIGVAWPVLASHLEEMLGLTFDFIPAPQETPEGKEMRRWITESVQPVERERMITAVREGIR